MQKFISNNKLLMRLAIFVNNLIINSRTVLIFTIIKIQKIFLFKFNKLFNLEKILKENI